MHAAQTALLPFVIGTARHTDFFWFIFRKRARVGLRCDNILLLTFVFALAHASFECCEPTGSNANDSCAFHFTIRTEKMSQQREFVFVRERFLDRGETKHFLGRVARLPEDPWTNALERTPATCLAAMGVGYAMGIGVSELVARAKLRIPGLHPPLHEALRAQANGVNISSL